MITFLRQFCNDRRGAVAVTYALALTALIAIGGVSFDYARLATLDSELQGAADDAALAAATQLDGKAGARAQAQAAVNNYFANSASAVVNRTLMANDKAGSAITGVAFTFYQSYNQVTDTPGAAATSDANAKVVKVSINPREAFYALTPIVGALRSGNVSADAVATLESGTCKLPPLMVCGPTGNLDFPTSADVGKGLLMKVGASGQWFPGNFGYLDFGAGAKTVKELLGTNSANDLCVVGSDVTTQPGNIANATDYLNTRFDVYTPSLTAGSCLANGDYCPAKSTRKDLVIKEVFVYSKILNGPPLATPQTYPAAPARPACGAAAPAGATRTVSTAWEQLPATALPTNAVVGFPRDTCHYSGTCAGGNVGDKIWDNSGYYAAHGYLPAGLTLRYDIYKWERDNPGSGLLSSIANTGDGVTWDISKNNPGNGGGGCKATDANCGYTPTWTNYCSYPYPKMATTANSPAKDRRLLTVAVIDCPSGNTYGSGSSSGGGGKLTTAVKKWMDVFLIEPSLTRAAPKTTSSTEIYAEIVGVATRPDGGNAFQYYGRQKAVLLK